jgi:hypothetical protein
VITLCSIDESLQVAAQFLVELTQSMNEQVHQRNAGQPRGLFLFCTFGIYFDVIEIGQECNVSAK